VTKASSCINKKGPDSRRVAIHAGYEPDLMDRCRHPADQRDQYLQAGGSAASRGYEYTGPATRPGLPWRAISRAEEGERGSRFSSGLAARTR